MKNAFLLFSLVLPLAALAQKKIKTIEVSDTIVYSTVDRPGDIYIVTKEGQIQKFDKDGKLIVVYRHKGAPTLFDPRDGAKLFAYYRAQQEYDYLNPSFDMVSAFRIDPAFAIEPWLIAPSGEKKLWVLDNADHSLKKVNPVDSEVEVEVVIDAALIEDATAFTAIREYQNFVFLLNPKRGILVFNSLGKHIKNILATGINSFNFLGEELYYAVGDTVKFIDLFTAETREQKLDSKPRNVILTDERMVLISLKSFDIFEYTP
ncbi:MAG TPA: hypothetical protein VGD65_21630 [Chryseosolibacter sp.]